MLTTAKIRANRQNALKSTGPRTPAGKAAVTQNALKHGLTARQDVISSESQADFDRYRDRMLVELAPIGPMESMLADRVVSLSWRLKRTIRIQNQAIDAMLQPASSTPLSRLTQSLNRKFNPADEPDAGNADQDLTLGRAAIKDLSNARVLERLLMYERRVEHSLYRTILELQRLNLVRASGAWPPPGPRSFSSELS